jgi:hypothetical protein
MRLKEVHQEEAHAVQDAQEVPQEKSHCAWPDLHDAQAAH